MVKIARAGLDSGLGSAGGVGGASWATAECSDHANQAAKHAIKNRDEILRDTANSPIAE